MKKNLLIAGIALFSLPLIAQEKVSEQTNHLIKAVKPESAKTRSQNWYNYAEAMYELSQNADFFINYLFPDSLPFTNVTNNRRPTWHHTGQVLDPASGFFDAATDQGPSLLTTQAYRLDAIEFPYLYRRVNPSTNPDTLFIQTYRQNAMQLIPNAFQSTPPTPVALQNYNYQTNLGAAHARIDTILLTSAHEATSAPLSIELPLNLDITAGQKVAVSISYRPGHSYALNDVMDIQDANATVNAFVHYVLVDEDELSEAGIYNHLQVVVTSVRYNLNAQGWNGRFIPGNAFQDAIIHNDIWFHLTELVGIEKTYGDVKVTVAPNPVASGNNAKVNIEAANAGNASVAITDMMGRQISNINTTVVAGKQQVELNTAELVAGVYFVSLKQNGNTVSTTKLVVK